MAGNAVMLKHAVADAAGRRAVPGGDRPRRPAEGRVPATSCSATSRPTRIIAGGAGRSCATSPARSRAGSAIERAAAGTFTSLGLELGGKDPAYVRADANLTHAIENLVDGAFFNSGQCCCGIERIYVHETPLRPLRRRLRRSDVKQYVLGNPLDEATTLGPMAHKRFADLVREQIARGGRQGRDGAYRPEALSAPTTGRHAYLAPQVLTDVDHSMSGDERGELRPRGRHHEGARTTTRRSA